MAPSLHIARVSSTRFVLESASVEVSMYFHGGRLFHQPPWKKEVNGLPYALSRNFIYFLPPKFPHGRRREVVSIPAYSYTPSEENSTYFFPWEFLSTSFHRSFDLLPSIETSVDTTVGYTFHLFPRKLPSNSTEASIYTQLTWECSTFHGGSSSFHFDQQAP